MNGSHRMLFISFLGKVSLRMANYLEKRHFISIFAIMFVLFVA